MMQPVHVPTLLPVSIIRSGDGTKYLAKLPWPIYILLDCSQHMEKAPAYELAGIG